MALAGALLLVFTIFVRPQEFVPGLASVGLLNIAVGVAVLGIVIEGATGKITSWWSPQIPYLVAGSGGYWHLHTMAQDARAAALPWVLPNQGDTQLDAWVDDRHGFLRMTATPTQLTFTFLTVPRPQESWSAPPAVADTFVLDRTTHSIRPAG